MTIAGVEVDNRFRYVLLGAALRLEERFGRRLTDQEEYLVIFETARQLSGAPSSRLQ